MAEQDLISPNSNILIIVADNGVGITDEDQKRILERFTVGNNALDRSTDGAGLGLSLTKPMVESHDGTLELRSNV
jgi:two-component system sensor histidine kinase SenX3